MPYLEQDLNSVAQEHVVFLHHYGRLQQRCTEQARAQAREIERLQALIVRLRAQVIAHESALVWEREEHRRQLDALGERPGNEKPAGLDKRRASEMEAPLESGAEADWLEHSLRGADLVVCQTGCASHGSFWRVEDHCKRTGKTCVLVDQPGALRIVRIQPSGQTESMASELSYEKDMI